MENSGLSEAIFEQSAVGQVVLDGQFNIVRVNLAYAHLCGRALDELRGRSFLDGQATETKAILSDALRRKQATRVAARPQPGSGAASPTYFDWMIVPLLDEQEHPLLLVSLHEVTEHVQAAAALSESERRFRSLIAATAQKVWMTNSQGDVQAYVDQTDTKTTTWESLAGSAASTRNGWEWLEGLHPEDRERVHASWSHAVATGTPYAAEYRVRRRNAEYRHIAARGVPVLLADGRVGEWIGTTTDITDRKRSEEALRESEERFSGAFEHAAIGMALVAPDGRWLAVNRSLCELVGYSSEELLSKSFQDITHPEDLETDLAYMRQLLAGDIRFYQMEKRYLHKYGHVLWILLSVSLVRDAHGQPRYFVSQIKDINERKEAEKEQAALVAIATDINRIADFKEMLSRVQQRIAELLPCERVVTYQWDKALHVYRAIAWHGVPADLVADTVSLGFDPGDRVVTLLLRGETVVVNETDKHVVRSGMFEHYRLKAMSLVPLAVYGRRLGALAAFLEGGRSFSARQVQVLEGIAQQLGIAMEAYEVNRSQREEAAISTGLARVAQDLMASLAAPTLLNTLCRVTAEVLECDASNTLFWQPEDDTFRSIAAFGETDEEQEIGRVGVPRQVLDDLLLRLEQDEVAEVHAEAEERVVADLGTSQLYLALRRGHEIIGIQVATRRSSGQPFGTIQLGIGRGIAQLASLVLEHARVRQQLEQSNRLKSEFVATMSHELRTPLNIIIGYTDVVLDGQLGAVAAEQADVLERVGASARELEELIKATLDMSRLEKGQIPLDLEAIHLPQMLAELAAATPPPRHNDAVRLLWEIPADLPPLRSDVVKLKVILRNLIGNALKFTTEGSVKVSARAQESGVEICVTDTGIGMQPEALAIIFEPFRQAEATITHRFGGVGLGLYIVRRLLDVLGGSISVDTVAGCGSTFRVTLPQSTASEAAVDVDGGEAQPRAGVPGQEPRSENAL